MERQRLFFIVTIGALLAVLAIFLVIAIVVGNDDDQGGNINEDPEPESRAGLVAFDRHPAGGLGAPVGSGA